MTEDVTGKNDIVAFGEEEQAEQMLQILYSDFIRDRVIEKFDLMAHYEIDLDDQYKLTSLIKEWESKVKFKRTEYQSIRIDVLDTDPQMAADIANEIARLVDVVKNRMQKDRAAEALKVIESEYTKMRDHMKAVEAIASGNAQAATKLEQKLDTLAKYGSAFIALTDNSEYERERLILLRSKFEETKVDATEDVPHKFIVNQAWASEKKAYPIRWLVVVISTFSAFLFAVLAIIVIENYRKLQEQNVA
jgi:capsular polysaccharide biosynthesis protein